MNTLQKSWQLFGRFVDYLVTKKRTHTIQPEVYEFIGKVGGLYDLRTKQKYWETWLEHEWLIESNPNQYATYGTKDYLIYEVNPKAQKPKKTSEWTNKDLEQLDLGVLEQ